MHAPVFVGAAAGLAVLGAPAPVLEEPVCALAADGSGLLVLTTDGRLLRAVGRAWQTVVQLDTDVTCVLPVPPLGALIGTGDARLVLAAAGEAHPVASFDAVDTRPTWYTPWGGPPATRSMCIDPAGRIFVNVHVGGVLRSADHGVTWRQTNLDVDVDVHQVIAHATIDGMVAAATGCGLAFSADAGESWQLHTEGLHGHYLRSVAFTADSVVVSAAESFRGQRVALYRRRLADGCFQRCSDGLPGFFSGHVDTGMLDACGQTVAAATTDGTVFVSEDAGLRWRQGGRIADLTCVLVAPE